MSIRNVSRVTFSTQGSGKYAHLQFRRFLEISKRFEGQYGLFARAFLTIMHKISGIKLEGTFFSLNQAERGSKVYKTPMDLKKGIFCKDIDLNLTVVILLAVKAYILYAEGTIGKAGYWRANQGGGMIKQELRWLDLTPIAKDKGLEQEGIDKFVKHPFFADLLEWVKGGTAGPIEPGWLSSYRDNQFYNDVVAWLDGHHLLVYIPGSTPFPSLPVAVSPAPATAPSPSPQQQLPLIFPPNK